ncbi:ABC transporter permease subunit [Paraburkholderia sp. UYCP14C]|uniref:amino acid ABC transporter permease n=1 Tax=Paraburkholderia sp. UYCP14C TaxID=2511130 RepID=UPI00101F3A2D|nr:ABC transporter permease subunit [Paraburkholderia sp. UYCP14C]RZF23929.1 ABC transporter permease subunit [Paraburkholderia sp. UYCP14C]
MDSTLPYLPFIVEGLIATIGVSLTVFAGAASIGLFLSLSSGTARRGVGTAVHLYVALFRSLPELLCVFIVYYGSEIVLRRVMEGFGLASVSISPFAAVTIALAVQFGAYCSEIFGDARRTISPGLIEAAEALGMTGAAVALRVTVPLMVRAAIPGLGNLFLVILKISALASVIGLEEVTRRAKIVAGTTREPFAAYLIAAACFLAITAVASLAQHRLHRAAQGAHS